MGRTSISPRTLTITYCTALALIAGLSMASHALLDLGLNHEQGSAAVVNVTGRQRMLSQRVASLAAQYRLGDAEARRDLLVAIAAFEAAHDALVAVTRHSRPITGSVARLQSLYFGDPPAAVQKGEAVAEATLDTRVRSYIADARSIAAMAPDDPAMPPVLARLFAAARASLLDPLDRVVSIQQAESERKITRLRSMLWGILAVLLLTLLAEAVVIFRPMIQRISSYVNDLIQLASTDPLTGAPNRRSFMERCAAEAGRAGRYGHATSLLMIDADRFKLINDTYGHAAGDAVLNEVCVLIRQTLRQADIWGRLGGEEFGAMLVETEIEGATVVAERLRQRCQALKVRHRDQIVPFTVSIGVAALSPGGLEASLRQADRMLYRAKEAGRNCVVGETPALAVA